MPSMKFHPAAASLPLLEGAEYDAFVEDIRAKGLENPIIITSDKLILDGRNRLRACEDLGIKPKFEEYRGDDPAGFVDSLNIHRRHLNAGQRVARLIDSGELSAAPRDTQGGGNKTSNGTIGSLTSAEAEARAGVGSSTVTYTRKVARISKEIKEIADETDDDKVKENVLAFVAPAEKLYPDVKSGAVAVSTAYEKALNLEASAKMLVNKKKQKKKKARETPQAVADFLTMMKDGQKLTNFSIEATNEGLFNVDNPGLIARKTRKFIGRLDAMAALLESKEERRQEAIDK